MEGCKSTKARNLPLNFAIIVDTKRENLRGVGVFFTVL